MQVSPEMRGRRCVEMRNYLEGAYNRFPDVEFAEGREMRNRRLVSFIGSLECRALEPLVELQALQVGAPLQDFNDRRDLSLDVERDEVVIHARPPY